MNEVTEQACPKCGKQQSVRSAQSSWSCTDCGREIKLAVTTEFADTVIVPASTANADTVDNGSSDSQSKVADVRQKKTLDRLGRFELKELLGAGGFGKVYKAFDPQLDRVVAIKVPSFSLSDLKNTERFLTEAKSAARLKHPNIVTTYEVGKSSQQYFIATEFIQGAPMNERIRRGLPDVREAALWVSQLAKACGYAHQKGIVHRDIKPHNIMIDHRGSPQLMDFGLAKRMDDETKATSDGTVLGTPAYMSPEQARGEISQLTAASDQYSLGVVLFQLLTGETPVSGSAYYVISQVAAGNSRTVRDVKPDLPEQLDLISRKAMSSDVESRYTTCQEFADDLDAWLQGRPISALNTSKPNRMSGWLTQGGMKRPAVVTLCSFFLAIMAWQFGPLLFNWENATPDQQIAGDPINENDSHSTLPDVEIEDAPPRPALTTEQAQRTNDRIWKLARADRGVNTKQHLSEMKWVCHNFPQANYFSTLGAAEYRAGEYKEAIAYLMRSRQQTIDEGKGDTNYANPAFLALAHLALNDEVSTGLFVREFSRVASRQQANRECRQLVTELKSKLAEGTGVDSSVVISRFGEANLKIQPAPAPPVEEAPAAPAVTTKSAPQYIREFKGWRCGFAALSERVFFNSFGSNDLKCISVRFGRIHTVSTDAVDVAAAPAGSRLIAFTVPEGSLTRSGQDVWVMNTDGSQKMRVGNGGYPSWSKDGNTLFFHDGGLGVIKSWSPSDPSKAPTQIFNCFHLYPSISPSGDRVVFQRSGKLVIASVVTRKDLFTHPLDSWKGLLCGWSPDGKYVLFSDYGYNGVGLWALNTGSKKIVKVLDGNWTLPRFSPNGEKLVCEDRKARVSHVYNVSDLPLPD